MTPTGELRAKLSERGIDWWPDKYYRDTNTCWRVSDFEWRASEKKDGKLLIGCTCVKYLTPEQAIAATVGGRDASTLQAKVKAQGDYISKLHNEYKAFRERMEYRCTEHRNTIRRLKAELDAATVGAGMCHMEVCDNLNESEGMGDVWLECDECHWQMPLEPTTPRFNYCPNCGRRIEEVDG